MWGINIRKKIKFNGKQYNINVYGYCNGRMKLKYINKTECHDITVDLNDTFLEDGKVFLDPFIVQNGLIKILIKNRIIRDVTSISYNYVEIPIAKVNIGILKQYDKNGVYKYLDSKEGLQ